MAWSRRATSVSNYLNHITLATGHCRRSPRHEVDDATIAILHPWLQTAIHSGRIEPLPVAPLSHYGARAIKQTGLVVTIYAPSGPRTPGRPHTGEHVPIATIGIAQRSREAKDLWGLLVANFGAERHATMPEAPWCAVAIHGNIVAYPQANRWLGDLERCIAWAWITRNVSLRVAGDDA